jgi:hypothetical protein
MNYLIITDEFVLSSLTPELRKAYDHYVAGLAERTEFQTLRSKRNSNKISLLFFQDECRKLVKRIKHMTYEMQKNGEGLFRVRPYIDGKRISLGTSSDFDEACGFMSEYLKSKMEIT